MSEQPNDASGVVTPFDFEREPARYLYEIMADHLEATIRNGDLALNTRLPAEVDLARQYGVSLGTTRHATRLLGERGLVKTVPCKGTYVIAQDRAEHAEAAERNSAASSSFVNSANWTDDWIGIA